MQEIICEDNQCLDEFFVAKGLLKWRKVAGQYFSLLNGVEGLQPNSKQSKLKKYTYFWVVLKKGPLEQVEWRCLVFELNRVSVYINTNETVSKSVETNKY